jgi:glycosyltransferase involved in cell wall biosynthesis
MNILILGCKEWPYGYGARYEKFPGGGTAKHIQNLVDGFGDQHEFHIISRSFPGQAAYEENGQKKIYRVPFINNKILRLPSFAWNAYKRAKKIKAIDIVHAHTFFAGLTAMWLKRKFKKDYIYTPHGIVSTQWKGIAGKVFFRYERKVIERAGHIIFFDKNDRQKYIEVFGAKVAAIPYSIIPNGMPVPETPDKKLGEKVNILFIGRIVTVKNLDKIIKGIAMLPENIKKNVHFTVCGDGYLRSDSEKLVKELNLRDLVSFEGFVEDIHPYLERADLFVLASDHEGMPMAVIEAMAYKVLCIMNDISLPFKDGTYVKMKNNDPETIMETILHVINDPEGRKIMTKDAYDYVKKEFSVEGMVALTSKVYEEFYGK